MLCAIVMCIVEWSVRRLIVCRSLAERRLLLVFGASFICFGGFFAINNAANGFVFSSWALAPVVVAWMAGHSRRACRGLLLMSAVSFALGAGEIVASSSFIQEEIRFLDTHVGSTSVLLVPGCPLPEVIVPSHLNLLGVRSPTSQDRLQCNFSSLMVDADAVLRSRVRWWLEHGHGVWYALSDDATDYTTRPDPDPKSRQIFFVPEPQPEPRMRKISEVSLALERAGLRIEVPVRTPRFGTPMLARLLLGKDHVAAGGLYASVVLADTPGIVEVAAPAPVSAGRVDAMVSGLGHSIAATAAVRYMQSIPNDPWLECDLEQLACEKERGSGAPDACRLPPGCRAR